MPREEIELDNDNTDMPSSKLYVSNWDIFHMIFSIVTHVIDIGLDINVAAQYFLDGQMSYFAFTTALVILPSFINSVVSTQMHRQDDKENANGKKSSSCADKMMDHGKHLFVLLFQVTPIIRYFYCLKYALKSRKCKKEDDREGQRHFYVLMLREEQDVSLIRSFECFMEAAPQQILQITIMITHHHAGFNFNSMHQIGSVVSSLVSMGWAMATYHRNIRLAQWNKQNISSTGMILQFLWHFFITVSRIISICAIASISVLYAGISCSVHWLVMTVWIVWESRGIRNFCKNRNRPPHTPLTLWERIHSITFACVLGIVYIFVYLNHEDGPTFLKHLFFYSLCSLENISAALTWIFLAPANLNDVWFMFVVPTFCIVPLVLGIAFMIVYYTYFHPRAKNDFYFQNQPSSVAT